jgi:hypothetical protein
MQNTRLTTLIDRLIRQFTQWTENPWRRLSLVMISLLFGNFLATAISTSTGQKADLDIAISITLLGIVELISWLTYRNDVSRPALTTGRFSDGDSTPTIVDRKPFWIVILNSVKLGLVYGLFVEAFKLGS